jgi:hypothetical protein
MNSGVVLGADRDNLPVSTRISRRHHLLRGQRAIKRSHLGLFNVCIRIEKEWNLKWIKPGWIPNR